MNPEFPTDRTPEKHHRAPVFLNNDASVAPVSAAHLVPLSRYAIAGPSWRLSSPRTPASACSSGAQMFLAEFDLTDNRSPRTICSISSCLASRPPAPRQTRPRRSPPRPPHCVRPPRPPPPPPPPPRRRVPAPVAVDPALARGRRRSSRVPPPPPSPRWARRSAISPGPRGRHPAEKLWQPPRRRYADPDLRPFDGVGQLAKMPILGGCGAPYSVCVKSSREYLRDLPPARDVVRLLHLRPDDDAFVPHPNGISVVLLAFAKLVSADLGLGGDSLAANNPMSSYLDLQVLYGTNAGECDDVRGGTVGVDPPGRRRGPRARRRRRGGALLRVLP